METSVPLARKPIVRVIIQIGRAIQSDSIDITMQQLSEQNIWIKHVIHKYMRNVNKTRGTSLGYERNDGKI